MTLPDTENCDCFGCRMARIINDECRTASENQREDMAKALCAAIEFLIRRRIFVQVVPDTFDADVLKALLKTFISENTAGPDEVVPPKEKLN